jgi:hypothetical protein
MTILERKRCSSTRLVAAKRPIDPLIRLLIGVFTLLAGTGLRASEYNTSCAAHHLAELPLGSPILKFVTRSERLLGFVAGVPLLRSFLVYRADAISGLRNAAVRDYVHRTFFTSNATSKETSAGRFRDLDQIARAIITAHKLDAIHDIGVSSGITSLDLYRTLSASGIPCKFLISDKYAVYGSTGRYPTRIVDADGAVTELYFCGLLGKRAVSNKFPVTRLLHWLLADRPLHGPIRRFVLFDPQVLPYLENGLIHRIDYDVFTTRMPCAFSFVRCMNLLNLCYFPREPIQTALRNIIESLKEGGVLQIGRTLPDRTSHATFYVKLGARLEVLQQVGGGTELREVIEQL